MLTQTWKQPNGLTGTYDWPRTLKNRENLRGTRRWCQKTKKNFLQDGWDGKYEIAMFDARKTGESAIGPDFIDLMHEIDDDDSSRSNSPVNQVTWANEMQFTEGEIQEECPFSEDEESVCLDFPEEVRNAWENREWRDNYEIAINEAFQKIYDHNESIKNDPAKARMKPKDINPFWSHALQEIRQRNRDEDEEQRENLIGIAELPAIEFEDESDVTASAIYTATDSELGENENAIDLPDRISVSDTIVDDMPELEGSLSGEETRADDDAFEREGSTEERVAEVLIVERQEDVITSDDIIANNDVNESLQATNAVGNQMNATRRFDHLSFKARLIEFRKRQEMEWIFGNSNKNQNA